MKKVASSVKLDLAQYRELASFAQFGSDVDADTKERLEHGQILMEILTQPQYQTVAVENQVMIIYAAINRYLADIGPENVREFEKQFYVFMETQYPDVARSIRESGAIDEDTEKQLKEGIELFKKEFKKTMGIGDNIQVEAN